MEHNWYEEHGFDVNPFEADALNGESTSLIGREEEEKEIIYRILSSNMIFVEGLKGRGKTALLRHAIENFKGHGKVIYIDAKCVNKAINIEKLLIGANKVRGGILGKKPKNMILLIDNINDLTPRNWERVKYYFDQNYLKSVIFTGTNYKKINFPPSIRSRIGSRVIKLENLSEEEALQLIQERLGDNYEEILTDNEIMKLYVLSKGNIKDFLMNNFKLAQYKFEMGKTEVLDGEDLKAAMRTNVGELYESESDGEEVVEANLCETCGSKLVKVGEYYRCKECDTFCGNCGALIEADDKKCPECDIEFED